MRATLPSMDKQASQQSAYWFTDGHAGGLFRVF